MREVRDDRAATSGDGGKGGERRRPRCLPFSSLSRTVRVGIVENSSRRINTHPGCSSVRGSPAEISHCNGANVEPYAVRAREPVSGIGNILGDRAQGGREGETESRSERIERRKTGRRERCRVHATGRARSDGRRRSACRSHFTVIPHAHTRRRPGSRNAAHRHARLRRR